MKTSICCAVIAYDRPKHLDKCLSHIKSSLTEFSALPLYVFQDAPLGSPSRQWKHANKIALNCTGSTLIERSTHHGVLNIPLSIDDALKDFDAVIVVEDDVWVSKDYIRFMHACLNEYANCPEVLSVCGDQFDLPELAAQDVESWFSRCFLRRGFATWKRAWQAVDLSCSGWEQFIGERERQLAFDILGDYSLSDLLRRVCENNDPKFDLRWYYNIARNGGFSVMPTQGLIFDGGFNGGTHLQSTLVPALRACGRAMQSLGFGRMMYHRFYRGRARRAGNRAAFRGDAVFSASSLRLSALEVRHEQQAKYTKLLKRYVPKSRLRVSKLQ